MLDQLRQSIDQIPPRRRLVLGGLVVGVVAALVAVGRWAAAPDYALLFGDLSANDAGAVVEQLEADGVAYELRSGGTAVYVPSGEVHGLRIALASSGVVADGPAGYELFDGGTLGMTDFMQRLNVKRALEGELARTIGSVRQVERARVHLVLPERSPFRDQEVAATASVVLAVRGTLAPDQVAGVAALVAGAVEGLDPSSVTVLDEAGRMLTGPAADGDDGLSSAQLGLRREVEEHLAGAGQSMLDRMLGPGRAVVRVAADLDLSTTTTERNAVDPESQTVISEETQQEGGDGVAAESRVRNFEVTREATRAERPAGEIRALTVSVLLDEAAPPAPGAPGAEGEAPTPFSDDQLRQIEALVKNAVGFDDARGDRFAVQQIRFSTPEPEGVMAAVDPVSLAGVGLQYGVVLLALFLAYRLLRRITDAATAPPEPDAADPTTAPGQLAVDEAGVLVGPDGTPEPPLGTPARTTIDAVAGDPYAGKMELPAPGAGLDDVRAAVAADPEAAAAVVRRWLAEDAPAR